MILCIRRVVCMHILSRFSRLVQIYLQFCEASLDWCIISLVSQDSSAVRFRILFSWHLLGLDTARILQDSIRILIRCKIFFSLWKIRMNSLRFLVHLLQCLELLNSSIRSDAQRFFKRLVRCRIFLWGFLLVFENSFFSWAFMIERFSAILWRFSFGFV